MRDHVKLSIAATVVAITLMVGFYVAFFKARYEAALLSKYGVNTEARVFMSSNDPTPGQSYMFYVNSNEYTGGFNLAHRTAVYHGDSVVVTYFKGNPDINMVPEEVEAYASVWFSKLVK